MKKVLLLAVAACLLFAAPVMAKEGVYIGAFMPTDSISGDAGGGVSSGNGWGLRAGLGFNRYVAIEGHYTATKHDITGGTSADLKGYAGDLRLNFPLTELDRNHVMSLEPYVLLGYGHYELSGRETLKSDGSQWGLGIELYLFKELSIHGGWTTTKTTFKENNVDLNGNVKTVDFGLIYHFI